MGKMRNAYSIENMKGRDHFGRPRHRWKEY
jgi:hypothetical protein